ncbi:hypothetical protein NUACC21_35060 [Scytonema sp. NUACC21]
MTVQAEAVPQLSTKILSLMSKWRKGQTKTSDASVLLSNTPTVKLLLIDDQLIVGEAVHRILANEADISFHYVNNPAQAIQKAMEISPTVILLDLVMPEIDGLMLLRWFRSHAATCDIPIIMLSSKEEPELKAEAFAQGANDYLIKLPDKVELIARLRYHSKAYNNLRALTTATVTAQLQAYELEHILKELQATQVQLIQTEKMSGLGRMVAGVAHEINNPINFIYGNFDYLESYVQSLLNLIQLYQEEYPKPSSKIQDEATAMNFDFMIEDLTKIISSMKFGTERIREIVLSLRNFSRLDQADKKIVDVHEGIESTLLILNHRVKQGIDIVKEFGNIPLIECYPAQLNQVFMNILSNAIDALQEKKEESQKQIAIATETINDDFIRVTIRDNGPGIDSKIQNKIFEPFFTTKPVNQGTGLGLAISYQIIQKHHGNLMVISEPGKGAEFAIEIPVAQKS